MSNGNKTFNWQDGVSLKEYFESRLVSMDKTIEIARIGIDRRMDLMNEFRAALNDQTQQKQDRRECGSVCGKLAEDVKGLRESRAGLEAATATKAGMIAMYGAYLLGGLTLLVEIIRMLLAYTK
jgi:hypothetical protein